MSVTDHDQRQQNLREQRVDLSDLGTISEEELEAARNDPELQAENRAALEAVEALERDGRLIVG